MANKREFIKFQKHRLKLNNTSLKNETQRIWSRNTKRRLNQHQMSFPSVQVNCETVSHVGILDGTRGVRSDETDNPEDDCEDEGSDGQPEPACQPHDGEVHAVAHLEHLVLLLLLLSRLDPDHVHPLIKNCVGSLEHLVGGMQDHFQEGDCHREQHPDVNHLDVRGDRQALGESQKTSKDYESIIGYIILLDLHGCQDQQDGEIDLNDHVDVVFSKKPCDEADGKEEDGWDKYSQQIVDDWSAQGDLGNDGFHIFNA